MQCELAVRGTRTILICCSLVALKAVDQRSERPGLPLVRKEDLTKDRLLTRALGLDFSRPTRLRFHRGLTRPILITEITVVRRGVPDLGRGGQEVTRNLHFNRFFRCLSFPVDLWQFFLGDNEVEKYCQSAHGFLL